MHGGILTRRRLLRGTAAMTLGATVLATTSCTSRSGPTGALRVATGGSGGVYFRLGTGLAQAMTRRYPSILAEVLTTAASAANVKMVAAQRAELGFTQADVLTGAGLPPVLALARLYDDYMHLIIRKDDRLRSLEDLRGQRVSLGAAGSGTEVTAGRLLQVAGLRPGDDLTNPALGLDDSANALDEGSIDAFFFSGGLPVAAIAKLVARSRIRLLGLAPYVPPLQRRYGTVYAVRTIAASTYRTPPTSTLGVPNYLVVSSSMTDDTAYAITGKNKTVDLGAYNQIPSGQTSWSKTYNPTDTYLTKRADGTIQFKIVTSSSKSNGCNVGWRTLLFQIKL